MMGQNTMEPDRLESARAALEAWWTEAGVSIPPAPPSAPPIVSGPAPRAERAASSQARSAPDGSQDRGAAVPNPAIQSEETRIKALQSEARAAAASCADMEALRAAVEAFEGCALKRTAKNTVFARGSLASGVMIVGEAPGFDEDARGLPFVGRSGVLLDRMFAAIGLDREAIYVSNILFWRPPGNRNPSEDDIRACLPFVERHIALAAPKILVFAGKLAATTLLRSNEGIMRLRGRWSDYRVKDSTGEPTGETIPALPVLHPAFLLRQPAWKAQTWRDMLSLQARLEASDQSPPQV